MGNWSLSDIRTEVRKLAGRPSTSNPSDSDLNDRINRWIKFKLSTEVKLQDELTFWSFETSSGVGTQALDEGFHTFLPPAYVDDDPLEVFYDPAAFYNRWLIDSTETNSKPQDILIMSNEVVLRPIPDDGYTIRILAYDRPAELGADSTALGWESLGELVAYGSALDLLLSGGEFDKASALKPWYDRVRAQAQDKAAQMFVSQRSVPAF